MLVTRSTIIRIVLTPMTYVVQLAFIHERIKFKQDSQVQVEVQGIMKLREQVEL